jgi:hypothetical protein
MRDGISESSALLKCGIQLSYKSCGWLPGAGCIGYIVSPRQGVETWCYNRFHPNTSV